MSPCYLVTKQIGDYGTGVTVGVVVETATGFLYSRAMQEERATSSEDITMVVSSILFINGNLPVVGGFVKRGGSQVREVMVLGC